MKPKGFANLIIIIATLVALSAIASTYLVLENQKSKATPEPVFCTQDAKQCPDGSYVGRSGPKCEFAPCPGGNATIDTSTSSTSLTAGWKTYRNEQYGFEVEYPTGWKQETNCGAMTILCVDSRNMQAIIPHTDQVFDRLWVGVATLGPEQTQILVDGHKAATTNWSEGVNDSFIRQVYIDTPPLQIGMTATTIDRQKIFDQILSTFKFIQPAIPVNTSTWKTYRNEKYGFEVKYPSDYYVTAENQNKDEFFVDLSIYKIPPEMEYGGIRVHVSTFSGDFEKYIDNWIKGSVESGNDVYDANTSVSDVTKSKITIDGAVGYKVSGIPGPAGSDVLVVKDSQLFLIVNSLGDADPFNQILSTFKFTSK